MYMLEDRKSLIKARDVDLSDNIRPSAILDLFQDIAGDHANKLGLGFDEAYRLGFYWVILYEEIRVLKYIPKYDEEVKVITWPKPNGRLFCEREYEIRDKDNELIIKGISTWGLIDINTRRILRPSLAEFKGEFYPKTNYNIPPRHKLGLKEGKVLKEYKYRILLTDLDHNRHFNNARYLDVIYNMNVINDIKYKNIEIAFIHECYLDNIIRVVYYIDNDNNHCFIGYLEDGSISFEARYILED